MFVISLGLSECIKGAKSSVKIKLHKIGTQWIDQVDLLMFLLSLYRFYAAQVFLS